MTVLDALLVICESIISFLQLLLGIYDLCIDSLCEMLLANGYLSGTWLRPILWWSILAIIIGSLYWSFFMNRINHIETAHPEMEKLLKTELVNTKSAGWKTVWVAFLIFLAMAIMASHA